ncbi:hypothetical protein V5799_009233 [Amblyomma americanum]|uniref:Uncharacterized protein n=1 Tax=Amblyomma americanum TaxID=6943 RepID=A0AAQ4FCB2_AMBAM
MRRFSAHNATGASERRRRSRPSPSGGRPSASGRPERSASCRPAQASPATAPRDVRRCFYSGALLVHARADVTSGTKPIVKDLVLGLLVLLSMTLMLTAALILVVSDDEENGDMAGTTAPEVTTTGTEAEVATPVALPLHADSDDKLIAHYTMN